MKITVKLSDGNTLSKTFDKTIVTIGRSPKSDFAIPDEALSRHHCQIEINDNSEFFVTDLGSANGVFLDGNPVTPHERTKFTTFLQLSVGPLEFQVSDSEDFTKSIAHKQLATRAAAVATSSLQLDTKENNPNRKVKKSALPPEKESDDDDDTAPKAKRNLKVPILAALFIGLAAFYHFKGGGLPAYELEGGVVPDQFKDVSDEFLSAEAYKMSDSKKSCTSTYDTCKELFLIEGQEGVIEDPKNTLIFINPKRFLQNPTFENISQLTDAPEIISLYYLLQSQAFKAFQDKKLGQIHLVIKDDSGQLIKVLRFHTKYFASNERISLLTEIGTALDSKNTKPLWERATPIIKIQSL